MRFAAVDVASRYLTKPILLLDDIFAELDVNRRDAVASLIREKQCQVVIATPQAEDLPFKADVEIKLEVGSGDLGVNVSTGNNGSPPQE